MIAVAIQRWKDRYFVQMNQIDNRKKDSQMDGKIDKDI